MDGRCNVCENEAPLIKIVVEKVLLKHPGKVFSVEEIYQELVSRDLYRFSPDAKTPCNSIYTRLSTGVQARFPRLKKADRGLYYAA
jgi:hypothetical protein